MYKNLKKKKKKHFDSKIDRDGKTILLALEGS